MAGTPATVLNHEMNLMKEASLLKRKMKWACITEKCPSLVFLYGRELTFTYLTHFTNQIFWVFKSACLKSVWDENLDLQMLWDNQQAWLLLLLPILPRIPQLPFFQMSCTFLWLHGGWLSSEDMCVCVCVVWPLSYVLLFCYPMDCSPARCSARGIFQAKILDWVAIFFSRVSSQPRDQTHTSWDSCIGRQILYH